MRRVVVVGVHTGATKCTFIRERVIHESNVVLQRSVDLSQRELLVSTSVHPRLVIVEQGSVTVVRTY